MGWFRQTQKDSFDDVPIDSYYKNGLYCSFYSAIVDFYLFYDGAVDLTRSQCTVSDTQVTGKTHGPFVCFLYLTSRIHQEDIIAFQDKLN